MFYLLCYFGEQMTNRFSALSSTIYDVFYLYPVDQQKYFILMILNASKAVYLEGFVIQSLTLRTFRNVTINEHFCQ